MSFLHMLEKAGLVKLDDAERKAIEAKAAAKGLGKKSDVSMEDIDRLLREEGIDPGGGSAPAAKGQAPAPTKGAPPKSAPPAARPAPSSTSAPARPAAASGGAGGTAASTNGVALDALYAQSAVATSPYPAEKLLKLLDGLRAMDAHTRKTAVLAMDSADDSWSIADPVVDAKRKIRALKDAQQRLTDEQAGGAARVAAESQKLDDYVAQAVATIKGQIAELEKRLEKEIADVAAQKAQLAADQELLARSCDAERARLEDEVKRLEEVPRLFEASVGPA